MSEACRTRYEVQSLLRECILKGVSAMGLDADGVWDVMEFANATFDNADRIVTMNMTNDDRAGWTGSEYSAEDDTRTCDWMEVQRWQLQCVLKRPKDATKETLLAEDCASRLVTWFNTGGCAWLRSKGMSCLVVDGGYVMYYNDDSSLYQKRAAFSVRLCVPKSWTVGQEFADALKPRIKPI